MNVNVMFKTAQILLPPFTELLMKLLVQLTLLKWSIVWYIDYATTSIVVRIADEVTDEVVIDKVGNSTEAKYTVVWCTTILVCWAASELAVSIEAKNSVAWPMKLLVPSKLSTTLFTEHVATTNATIS